MMQLFITKNLHLPDCTHWKKQEKFTVLRVFGLAMVRLLTKRPITHCWKQKLVLDDSE